MHTYKDEIRSSLDYLASSAVADFGQLTARAQWLGHVAQLLKVRTI
jgi:hypothetical protein